LKPFHNHIIQKKPEHRFPFELPSNSLSGFSLDLYEQWDRPTRQAQISAMSFLTALLYIIVGFIDKPWASEQAQALMLTVHWFVIAPTLLTISFLAYKKWFYNFVMPVLALAPVLAMLCHAYILSKLGHYAPFLAEGYLCVFWTFIVSGATFRWAIGSASISSIILLAAGFYVISDPDIYVMHAFWIFCSFSFGLLGALIFFRLKKANFMTQQELLRMAVTDELTGAFNRNHLNSSLAHEMARDLRYNKAFGVLIVDIDHFKKINDSFGHAVGDEVLRKTAQVLSSSIRSSDTLVRWGREEFVVIAVEVDEKALRHLCENLRGSIEGTDYGPVVDKVTVSIGATLFSKNDTQDRLLLRADKALYEAKEKGRNRTAYKIEDSELSIIKSTPDRQGSSS